MDEQTQSTIPEPEFQPSPRQEEFLRQHQPNEKIWIYVLIGLGLVIVGGALGFYVWQKGGLFLSLPTPTPMPTVSPTPTADWKTYRNEQYGFEFRYPSDWTFKEDNGSWFDLVSISRPLYGDDSVKIDFAASNQKLGVGPSVGKSEWLDTVGGVTWRVIRFNDGVPGQNRPYDSASYEVELKGDKLYNIVISPMDMLETDSVDQILSTFKFIDSNINIIC